MKNYSAEIPLSSQFQPLQIMHTRKLGLHSPVSSSWTVLEQPKNKIPQLRKNIGIHKRFGEFTLSHF